MKKLMIFATAALLAGCAGGDYNATVQTARNTMPESPFLNNLKNEYLNLATIERSKPDNVDAVLYAHKAKMTAEGKLVLPDDLKNRGLLIEIRQLLTAERNKLLPLLEQSRVRLPQESAKAQAMFDCWAEEAEENFQPEDIIACRDQYFLAKTQLETRLQEVLAEEARPIPAPEPEPVATTVVYQTVETVRIPEVGRVLFEHNKAVLTNDAEALLKGFVGQINDFVPDKLVVNGYTDTSGTAEYNLKLSEKRAISVKNFLEAQGVKADVFETQGFGETKLQVPTADGVKEPANRLVEIVMMKK